MRHIHIAPRLRHQDPFRSTSTLYFADIQSAVQSIVGEHYILGEFNCEVAHCSVQQNSSAFLVRCILGGRSFYGETQAPCGDACLTLAQLLLGHHHHHHLWETLSTQSKFHSWTVLWQTLHHLV